MRNLHLVPICLPALALMAGAIASAQTGGGDWQKSYPVSGKASLSLSSGDASVEVRSCGDCREVRVRVEWKDRKPADFTVNEFQSGDHVNFELKEKPHLGIHFQMGSLREPHVTAETPTALDLGARTATDRRPHRWLAVAPGGHPRSRCRRSPSSRQTRLPRSPEEASRRDRALQATHRSDPLAPRDSQGGNASSRSDRPPPDQSLPQASDSEAHATDSPSSPLREQPLAAAASWFRPSETRRYKWKVACQAE